MLHLTETDHNEGDTRWMVEWYELPKNVTWHPTERRFLCDDNDFHEDDVIDMLDCHEEYFQFKHQAVAFARRRLKNTDRLYHFFVDVIPQIMVKTKYGELEWEFDRDYDGVSIEADGSLETIEAP